MFYLSAVIYVIGALFYTILGTGKEQSWNIPEDELLVQVDLPREERRPLPVFRNKEDPMGEDSGIKPTVV